MRSSIFKIRKIHFSLKSLYLIYIFVIYKGHVYQSGARFKHLTRVSAQAIDD
jgi:hypothetical protein